MVESNSWRNHGIVVSRGNNRLGAEATVVVAGVPRSGTSMVAEILFEAGIHMGDQLDTSVFEDRELSAAVESGNLEALDRLIAKKNTAHAVWGFKRPKAYTRMEVLLARLRAPRIIVTMRDPVAIGVRNAISTHQDAFESIATAAQANLNIAQLLGTLQCPLMAVSYEKALADPSYFCQSILEFCGILATPELLARLTAKIENGPEAYLQNARLIYDGEVNFCPTGEIRGWIMSNATFPVLDLMRSNNFVCDVPIGQEIKRPASSQFPNSRDYTYRELRLKLTPSKITPTLYVKIHGTVFRLRSVFAQPGSADLPEGQEQPAANDGG